MVAARFLEIDGRVDGAGRIRPESCRRPEAHLVPFTKSVEWAIPGKPLFYATAMPRRTGAMPLVVTTHDGRPTKIDGNPLHPASGGATDTFAQASFWILYDPSSFAIFCGDATSLRIARAFDKYIEDLRLKLCGRRLGPALRFWWRKLHSPTRERLRAELERAFPQMRWCVYEPFLSDAQNFARK